MEGFREIEVAKLRVAAANRMMEATQTLMETAKKEVEEAVSFLKDTEKRLEVIDVDADDVASGSRKRKKRKKMSKPTTRSNREGGQAQGGASVAENSTGQSTNGRGNFQQRHAEHDSSPGVEAQEGTSVVANSTAESLSTDRLAAERREAERREAERCEAEILAAERREAERLAAERREAERLAAERREAERLAAERREAERLAAERLEAERLEAERLAAERLAAERQKARDELTDEGRDRRRRRAIEQWREDFRKAVNKHRNDTLLLLKESGEKKQSAVPMDKILEIRSENRGLMQSLNRSVCRAGGQKLTDRELDDHLAVAEAGAIETASKQFRLQSWDGSQNNSDQTSNDEQDNLEQREAEFKDIFNKHRDETLLLIKESAERGEESVPMSKIALIRAKNVALMRAANILVFRAGGKQKTECELTNTVVEAEAAATPLYIKEVENAQKLAQSTSNSDNDTQSSITVSGCGLSQANGKYTRSVTEIREGAPTYRKQGTSNHKTGSFMIYRKKTMGGSTYWLMSVADNMGKPTQVLYKSSETNSTDECFPPITGWVVTFGGIVPAPKLTCACIQEVVTI